MILAAREFSSLIGTIYDAVLRPELWEDALGRLCRALDAKAASIHVNDPIEGRADLFVEHGTDPVWTALLMTRYAGMSPIGAAVLIAELEQPLSAFDFIEEEEFLESRFYKEWCAPQGYYDMLGAIIAKKPRQVGAVGVTRLRENGRFGAAERELVGLVAPHVRRAVTLSGLLEQKAKERTAIASVVDRLSSAVFILDRNGHVSSMNAAAQSLLGTAGVVAQSGKLISLEDERASERLRVALGTQSLEPIFIAARSAGGEMYLAVLMLLDPKAGSFALFINPQEPDAPSLAKPLAALFGFTPREVSVMVPLLTGKTIETVSEELGISLSTVRTHLNRLFAKTGTNRQIDLVQKVMSAMPPVRM